MSLIQNNPIFQAVSNNDTQALNNAIIAGHKINIGISDESGNGNGISCLDYAILTLKYTMVKPILVFVNLLLPSEKKAMLNQGLKTLIKCIDKYVSQNTQEDLNSLSLDYAVFDELKKAGADLSIVVDEFNMSIYHYAIKLNLEYIFNSLITSNINFNVVNSQNQSVLLYAFLYSRSSFMSTLISKIDKQELTVVEPYSRRSLAHFAIEQNNFEILQQLLEVESSITSEILFLKDDSGKSLLHYVVEKYSKTEAAMYIDYLVSKSLNIGLSGSSEASLLNTQDMFGDTPLHYAVRKHASSSECDCMIKKLVNLGASLYIKNSRGIMPIEMSGINKSLIGEIC